MEMSGVSVPEELKPILTQNGGMFTTAQANEVGVSEVDTMFGQTVRVYCLERTICDCLRNRNKMDIAILTDAIKRYAKRKHEMGQRTNESKPIYRRTIQKAAWHRWEACHGSYEQAK
jgi:hypothetical protein